MKLCARCKLDKSEAEFYFDTVRRKLYSYCKKCHGTITSDWATRNNDKKAANARAAYRKTPDKFRDRSRRGRAANLDAVKKRQRDDGRKLWLKCIDGLGGKCICCGEAELTMLEIDHVNNDGKWHRLSAGGAAGTYHDMIERGFPLDIFQVLCSNCNHSKRRNGGTCAHKIPSGPMELCGTTKRKSLAEMMIDRAYMEFRGLA